MILKDLKLVILLVSLSLQAYAKQSLLLGDCHVAHAPCLPTGRLAIIDNFLYINSSQNTDKILSQILFKFPHKKSPRNPAFYLLNQYMYIMHQKIAL